MSALSIRRAQAGDVAAIAQMMGEFFAYLAALDGSQSAFDPAAGRERLARDGFGERPLFQALIAEAGGGPVGYAIYNLGYWADALDGMVFISDLFVREAWRGGGVGAALMRRLAEAGREAGCRRLMWTVWNLNPAARAFYEKLGAEAIEEETLMALAI